MKFFPANLTAVYSDSLGQENLIFRPEAQDTTEFLYFVHFRGSILKGDDLEDFFKQFPPKGKLLFDEHLIFRKLDREIKRATLHIEACADPNQKSHVLYKCTCRIDDELYTSEDPGSELLDQPLDKLRAILRPIGYFHHCFSCKFSDYEPNTGMPGGHLRCFVENKEEYCQIASSEDAMIRKYKLWELAGCKWVDEFYRCDQFENRPLNWGYRR